MVCLVGSENAAVGFPQAMDLLRNGGSALDAVEIAIRAVEANAEDHTVGLGGYPNILGEVELDAGIMDGRDRASGAVAALKGYLHPISIARQVMERMPHVFLAGEGAARFAREMGAESGELLTEPAREVWAHRLQQDLEPEELSRLAALPDLWRRVEIATDPQRTHGTVNVIARDAQDHICVGVSTSGWAWKYPGRVGDSPIAGGGFYADERYGAAACTGTGEMAIRAATAHSVVFAMRMGATLLDASTRAMTDLNDLGGHYLSGMNFVAMDRDGNHIGFSSYKNATYVHMDGSMDAPEFVPRTYVAVKQRWEKSG